jgi:hypothetical protein
MDTFLVYVIKLFIYYSLSLSLQNTFETSVKLRIDSPTEYVTWMMSRGHRTWTKSELSAIGWDIDATAEYYLGQSTFNNTTTQLPLIMDKSDKNIILTNIKHVDTLIRPLNNKNLLWPEIKVFNNLPISNIMTWWYYNENTVEYTAYIITNAEINNIKHRVYWCYVFGENKWTCINIAIEGVVSKRWEF